MVGHVCGAVGRCEGDGVGVLDSAGEEARGRGLEEVEGGFEVVGMEGGAMGGVVGGRRAVEVEVVAVVADLDLHGGGGADRVAYGDVFHQAEVEFSAHNFEAANTEMLFRHFEDAEKECAALLDREKPLPLPAYDQVIKASHNFNLLDARGVISVTERQAYIGRVRTLAKRCAEEWLKTPAGGVA